MKLLILGATGGTGQQLVSQALEAGHEVTVFARDGAKARRDHDRLRVIQGDLFDRAALAAAMRGHDVVISALGRGYTFRSAQLMERCVPGILAAMAAAGLRRLVFTSSLGVGDSRRDAPLMAKIFFSTLLRDIYADKLIGDSMIRNSGLEWTIVQPSRMTDGPLTRTYRTGERLALAGQAQISRADVAHYLLAAAGDPATVRKTILVSQ
jgi:putative NADH-flavin reductase